MAALAMISVPPVAADAAPMLARRTVEMHEEPDRPVPALLVRWIGRIEDVLYLGVAALLILAAGTLLGVAAWDFLRGLGAEQIGRRALLMLGNLLLILMLVELLYTVRVSLHAQGLWPEPFLIVGLIAAMRRVLVITAETHPLAEIDTPQFDRAMMELALLTVLTLVLVTSIIMLRRSKQRPHETAAMPGAG
jgi:uncharacterized membrane protein (DUF373 family)